MAKTYNGIDVSVHNDNINWTKVKASGKVDFVMIRAGYGRLTSQKDTKFEDNYKGATAAGLHVGAYWYSYATTAADAVKEANAFLSVIKGKKFDMPVAFDIEESTQASLSKTTIDNIVTSFISTMEKAGYYVMLYSYEAFLKSKVSESVRKKYAIWCANTSTTPSITYGIHQYSFKGSVSGISKAVDLNRTTTNYPSIITTKGFNGYTKQSSTTSATKPTLETSGFKNGDKGDGVLALKKLLLIASSKKIITDCKVDSTSGFGSGTTKAVNAVLKKYGYKETGIAGSKFIALLYSKIK